MPNLASAKKRLRQNGKRKLVNQIIKTRVKNETKTAVASGDLKTAAGGWACIIEHDGARLEYSGGEKHTTNNQMELQALIEGLKNAPRDTPLRIVTDSEYLAKGVTQWMKSWIKNGWLTAAKKPVKNKAQWSEINLLLLGREYSFEWVKGHSGHEENERCDELAREAISKLKGR